MPRVRACKKMLRLSVAFCTLLLGALSQEPAVEIAIEPRDRLQLEQSSNAFISCTVVFPFDNDLEVSMLENGRRIMPYDNRITAKMCPQWDERHCTNVTISITSDTTQNNTSIVCEYGNWHTGVTVARSDPVLVTIKPPITEPTPTEQPTTEDTSMATSPSPSPVPTSVQQEPEQSDSRCGGSTDVDTAVWVLLAAVIILVAIIIALVVLLVQARRKIPPKENDLEGGRNTGANDMQANPSNMEP